MKERKEYWPKQSCVYLVTNTVNWKRYVGVTCRYLSQRKYAHFKQQKRGLRLRFIEPSVNMAVRRLLGAFYPRVTLLMRGELKK